MKPKFFGAAAVLLMSCLQLGPRLAAQQSASPAQPAGSTSTNSKATPQERMAALQLEMTNAFQSVLQIVNQPVRAFARAPKMRVSTYIPGWFHPGATKPNFGTVDVRQTQELIYAKDQYVTSDLNPGMVFLGQELEFNAMTKYFYTNRALPKHKLTEAEMLEINQLYRVIGRCEQEISRLQSPPPDETVRANSDGAEVPGGLVDQIRGIPVKTRALYGGIAIAALVFVVFVLRLAKR